MQDGRTALMRAVKWGYTAIVQYLVEETTAQVNVTDNVSHSNSVFCTYIVAMYSTLCPLSVQLVT